MIDVKDIYYLAGWLEGEGSFTVSKDGNARQFRIEFSSTDFDTMEKVKKLMRSKDTIFLRKQKVSEHGTMKKPEYYMKVYNVLAISWMMTLYSLMSERRKNKIKDNLLDWKSYVHNGSGLCRKCKGLLVRTVIKSGWNKGKAQTYCSYCRGKKVA